MQKPLVALDYFSRYAESDKTSNDKMTRKLTDVKAELPCSR